jgi:cytoskeletal protein RodZ
MRSKKPPVHSKKSKRFANAIGAGVIGLAAVCLVATAILIARQPSQPADTTAAETPPQEAKVTEPSPKKVAVPQVQAKKIAVTKPPAVGEVRARTLTTGVTMAKAPEATARTSEAAAKAPEAIAKAPETMVKAPAVESGGVTITGCLERDNDTFRLRDTTGADAPKARSWKSGFLKKGSASIEIVDAANRLKLSNHIGQRVSVTGMLLDREMQARSLQRVGASCDQSPA